MKNSKLKISVNILFVYQAQKPVKNLPETDPPTDPSTVTIVITKTGF